MGWISHANGRYLLILPRAEMGQNIATARSLQRGLKSGGDSVTGIAAAARMVAAGDLLSTGKTSIAEIGFV